MYCSSVCLARFEAIHLYLSKMGIGLEVNRVCLLRLLVFSLLFCYFVLQIVYSARKLQDAEIGISFGRKREELVEGSHLCYFKFWNLIIRKNPHLQGMVSLEPQKITRMKFTVPCLNHLCQR